MGNCTSPHIGRSTCHGLLRNDRALYRKLTNLICKRSSAQPDVINDEGGPERRRSARIVVNDLHPTVESIISGDIGPITRCVDSTQFASAASQEGDPNTLHQCHLQVQGPSPPSTAPVNPLRPISSTILKSLNSSDTNQVQAPADSFASAPRRPLRPASHSWNFVQTDQAVAPPTTEKSEILMQM